MIIVLGMIMIMAAMEEGSASAPAGTTTMAAVRGGCHEREQLDA